VDLALLIAWAPDGSGPAAGGLLPWRSPLGRKPDAQAVGAGCQRSFDVQLRPRFGPWAALATIWPGGFRHGAGIAVW
jgi:hypothetical protein